MTPPDFSGLRIGYAPYSPTFEAPGDRRRFVRYARARGLDFELADPAKPYDLVVLSERADISVWRRFPGAKIVYDLIDSYLAIPRTDLKGALRGVAKFASGQSRHLQIDHWSAIAQMCRRADAVVCSTEEQRSAILPFNPNAQIILDIHSPVASVRKQDFAAHQPFRLVWEGLPQWLGSFSTIAPVLSQLARQRPIELHLVTDLSYNRFLGRYGRANTADAARRLFSDVVLHPWREADCAQIIASCDLALIPIDGSDPFAAGKPENKLLLFWRMGMPVLTSATPAYARAMALAGLDMTCAGPGDWQAKLETYVTDESARREAGRRGLACAEERYSEAQTLALWDDMFASVLGTAQADAKPRARRQAGG